VPFIVQELLEGEDLLKYARRLGGKIPVDEAIDILIPVVTALGHAHSRGVVHRDIKPENVFLATAGGKRVPKLLDFGISRIRTSTRVTREHVTMGTPAYMAPEHIEGLKNADARSDVWGLGVLLFELVSGELPFTGEDARSIFVKIVTTHAPTLKSVAPFVADDISLIVARCLRRDPDARYPTAAELARDLEHARSGTDLEPTGKRSIPVSMPTPGEMTLPGRPAAMSRSVVGGGKLVDDEPLATADTVPHEFSVADSQKLVFAAQAGKPLPAAGVPAAVPKVRTERMAPVPTPRGGAHVVGPARPPSDRLPAVWRGRIAAGLIVAGFALVPLVLLAIFHRTGGWPIARIVISGSPFASAILHAALGSIAAAFAVARGASLLMRTRGRASPSLARVALESALIGLGEFAAIEFLTAMAT
jgi:hypothetical protein